MRGLVEVDRESGAVVSKLSQMESGATLSEMPQDQLEQIGTNLTNILQDVNLYMRMNGGEDQLGPLQKITLKLDEHHFVNIISTNTTIKAHVEMIKAAQ